MARKPSGISGISEAPGCMTSVQTKKGNKVLVDYK